MTGSGNKSDDYKCAIKKSADDPTASISNTLCKINVPDCSLHGGYNPKDLCMQTCASKTRVSNKEYCSLKCIDYDYNPVRNVMEKNHGECLVRCMMLKDNEATPIGCFKDQDADFSSINSGETARDLSTLLGHDKGPDECIALG